MASMAAAIIGLDAHLLCDVQRDLAMMNIIVTIYKSGSDSHLLYLWCNKEIVNQ